MEQSMSATSLQGSATTAGSDCTSAGHLKFKGQHVEPERQSEMFAEPPLDCRVTALETSLRELGTLFVKYQQDVAGILVSECVRVTQQMQDAKQKIESTVHTVVQEAMSTTRSQITQEILDTVVSAKYREDASTGETAGTETSINTEVCAELMRLMHETRRNFLSLHNDLTAHRSLTEGRLVGLERRIEVQERQSEISSLVRSSRAQTAGLTADLLDSLKDAEQQLTLPETPPRHSAAQTPDSMNHLERHLESLGSVLRPEWSAEQIAVTGPSAQPVLSKAWHAEKVVAIGAEKTVATGPSGQQVQPTVLFWPARATGSQGIRTSSRQRAANASASPQLPESLLHGRQPASPSEVSPRGRRPGSLLENGLHVAGGPAIQPRQSNVLFWPATASAGDTSARSPSLQSNAALMGSIGCLLEGNPQNSGSSSVPLANPMITPRGSLPVPAPEVQQVQPKVLFWPAKANTVNGTPSISQQPTGQAMGILRTISPHRGRLSERSPSGSRPGSLSDATPRGAKPGSLHIRFQEGEGIRPGSIRIVPARA